MGIPGPALKHIVLIVLIVVIVGFAYFRMTKGRCKRRQLHGRDRLHAAFKQRRRTRLCAATTWEERRRLMGDYHAGRRIRPELVSARAGDGPNGRAGRGGGDERESAGGQDRPSPGPEA